MTTLKERTESMLDRYGEAVKKAKAGEIISRSPTTIRKMLEDGRLDYACAGEMVCVRSLARYISAPAQIDSDTRLQKRGNVCAFRV